MSGRKVHLSLSSEAVITLGRQALWSDRFVYVLVTNTRVKYPNGKSRIVYIGTTKRGARRVASSVAHRGEDALERRGARTVEAHLLTYTGGTRRHNLWKQLERAALVMFRMEYGSIPLLNKVGKHFWPGSEFDHFSKWTLLKKLKQFE